MDIQINGFLRKPKELPRGGTYRGRLALDDVQWTGSGGEAFVTVTITAEQLLDAADNGLLWTDQAVQRGISPAAPPSVPRELRVADGYPNTDIYIFDPRNADDMTEKLLYGERMFLSPLVWNMRPGTFEAYWSEDTAEIFVYSGKVFLPDSHHRHQAILKAVRAYREHPAGYPRFSPSRQLKVELYFLDREDEGNYFFDKNQRPKPTAQSKAFDLTTQDDLSVLAKRVLQLSPDLDRGVNRATDRLSKRAPHFMTLSTLREMMRTFAGTTEVDEAEMEGLAVIAAEFFDLISTVRPELRPGTPHVDREGSLASAAVMLHGYAALMNDYSLDLGQLGPQEAREVWSRRLQKLDPAASFFIDGWSGDLLSIRNPLWEQVGITKRNPQTDKVTVTNTGGGRARAGRVLRRFLADDFADPAELAEA